jgi:hypothetical protein
MISYRESQLKRVLDELNKPSEILYNDTKIWKNKEGRYHRLNDKPAIEYLNGIKEWWINGKRHRGNNKPAIEYPNGIKEWWINGKFIKRNYDSNETIYNNKFFDWFGEEIKTTTAQLIDMIINPGNIYENEKGNLLLISEKENNKFKVFIFKNAKCVFRIFNINEINMVIKRLNLKKTNKYKHKYNIGDEVKLKSGIVKIIRYFFNIKNHKFSYESKYIAFAEDSIIEKV